MSSVLDFVTDCGGVADGVTDDSPAFRAAYELLHEHGGALALPPGTIYLASDLVPPSTIRITGAGPDVTTLLFAEGKGVRLGTSGPVGGPINPTGSVLEHFTIRCTHTNIPEIQGGHAYSVGDRVRSALAMVDVGNIRDVDCGLHFLCIQAGTTSDTSITSVRPDDTFTNGSTIWRVEDWSGLSVSVPHCLIQDVWVNYATDCGIFVFGSNIGGVAYGIGDSNMFVRCRITTGDGHGIFVNGDDGNNNTFVSCTVQGFSRGVGFYDSGFFSNLWLGCASVLNRRGYQADGNASRSAFLSCYDEAATSQIIVESPNVWLGGTGGPSTDSRATGLFYDGANWLNGLSTKTTSGVSETRGGPTGLERLQASGDVGAIITELTTTTEDPIGFLRQAWSGSAYAVARDLTMPRSVHSPAKVRYPQGFYLGENLGSRVQRRLLSLHEPPTADDITYTGTRLYYAGDLVLNTHGGSSEPGWWRASRNGGWGGGIFYGGARTWQASHELRIGEGAEPSTASGKVYRIRYAELLTGSTWARDPSQGTVVTSTTEPTWSSAPSDGDTVTEQLASGALVAGQTHRIVWECFGDVGMDWDVGPTPSSTVST